jgi:outer membrane protein assembly factor BamB
MRLPFALMMAALLVGLLGACASDESAEHHDSEPMMGMDLVGMTDDGVDPRIARMRALESQVESIAAKKVWSARFGGGGRVERAWISGTHLLLEVMQPGIGYEIHDVDLRDGKGRWITNIGDNPLDRAPHDGDGSVGLITARDNGLTVVNDITGSRFYNVRTRLGAVPSSDARGLGPTLFMGDQLSGRFVAVDAKNGQNGWTYRAAGRCVGTPVVTMGMPRQLVIFATNAGWIYGMPAKAADGVPPENPAWAHNLGGNFSADPTFAMVGEGDEKKGLVVFPGRDGWVYGCDPTTGGRNWVLRTDSPFGERAVVSQDRVFVRNADRFFCLDATTGKRAWWPASAEGKSDYEKSQLFEAPEGFELADRCLTANGERAILISGRNRLMRCNMETGAIETETALPAFDFFLTNEATGELMLGTRDGVSVAYE